MIPRTVERQGRRWFVSVLVLGIITLAGTAASTYQDDARPRQPRTTPAYFAGLLVDAMRVFNFTGVADTLALSDTGMKMGDPTHPAVGVVSNVVSNNGNAPRVETE